MAEAPIISITPADIAAKRKEVEEHEMAAKRGREWLKAAEILTGMMSLPSPVPRPEPSTLFRRLDDHIDAMDAATGFVDPPDLTGAIEKIAQEAAEPVTKAVLKDRLRALNFSEDRLSNYFYTAVMRLRKRGRIQVLDDGRVWKPQP